jgi:hypothetical protein
VSEGYKYRGSGHDHLVGVFHGLVLNNNTVFVVKTKSIWAYCCLHPKVLPDLEHVQQLRLGNYSARWDMIVSRRGVTWKALEFPTQVLQVSLEDFEGKDEEGEEEEEQVESVAAPEASIVDGCC